MAEPQDTEISLGAGKLLGLFFGLVVLCGAFFGVGYMIGKNTAALQQPAPTDAQAATPTNGAAKPSSAIGGASSQPKPQDSASTDTGDQQSSGSDLTFYKTVEEKNLNPQLDPPASTPAPSTAQPSQKPVSAPPAAATTVAGSVPTAGYVVQVAAVSKQQDADALVAALRKKQYPVFVSNNPPSDKLFHVQAGPFADIKEAEAVKARLTNDGYTPILKR
jgi:DedD protein